MKRYAEYKDSSIEWMGEIPRNWCLKKLKYISSMKSGDSITSENIEETGDYPVYGGNGLRGYTSRFTHEGEYILIGRQGALCGNVRKVSGKFWPSEHAVVVYDKDKVNRDWYLYFLENMNLNQYSTSAAQPGLSVEQITNLFVCVPDRKIQESIAAHLNKKNAAIDTLIADKQKLIDLLKEKRQTIISEAVTKGLDKNAKMKDSGIEWIGEIPEEWATKRLKFCVKLRNEKATEIKDYVGLENIESYTGKLLTTIGESVIEGQANSFYRGDVLFGKLRPYLGKGFQAQSDGQCSGEILVFEPQLFEANFLLYLLLSYGFIEWVNSSTYGSKMPRANWDFIGNMLIPLPSVDVQRQIINYLVGQTEKIDSLVSDIQSQIEKLKEYRQSIISEAVTGKVAI